MVVVTILILIDGFLQYLTQILMSPTIKVTILILIDGFLQYINTVVKKDINSVTILILIDGFLQSKRNTSKLGHGMGHNPYFNRWFSAIPSTRTSKSD